MYLSKIQFNNYGPLVDVNLRADKTNDGKPRPIVLFGQNGSGKTLVLSTVLHAIVEIKRRKYNQINEVSGDNYYRVSSLSYINSKEVFAYNRIEFTENASFTEIMTRNYEMFREKYSMADYQGVDIDDIKLKTERFFNHIAVPSQNVFETEVFLFFPVERYYTPTWINKTNEKLIYASNEQKYVGKSSSNMIKYNVLASMEDWLLDVIIDRELYERKYKTVKDDAEGIIYEGRNNTIIDIINKFLTIIFKHKGYNGARIAVAERVKLYRQISIVGRIGDKEETIIPKLSNVSSGEAMVLGMMASILREVDRVSVGNIDIKEIKGIVLIDEIDAHMHSDFIKEALPELINYFSGIQFIVSSHSPFFLLGMQEYFADACSFIELPYGVNADNLIDFREIKNSFETVNKTYGDFIDKYVSIKEELDTVKLPMIITEGKTDWKHLKHALEVFHGKGMFKNVKVKFLEYENNMGNNTLEAMLEKLAMIPLSYPIIGIFDNDTKDGKKYIEPQKLGDNVFACSITDTQGYGNEISIELLYSRNDLIREWPNNKRIFLSDEFSEKSHRLKADPSIVSQNKTINDAHKRGIVKVVDSDVYDLEEKSIAISKNEFATCVYESKYPYENISVDGFKDIFQTIENLLSTTCEEKK